MESFESIFETDENISESINAIVNEDNNNKNDEANDVKSKENTIGDGLIPMQKVNSVIETQASTSRSKTKAKISKNGQTREKFPRLSKSRAKYMITNISKGVVPKSAPQYSKRSVRSSFKRKAARSDAALRRRLNRTRSTDSFISNLCPRCGHSCCNWYSN